MRIGGRQPAVRQGWDQASRALALATAFVVLSPAPASTAAPAPPLVAADPTRETLRETERQKAEQLAIGREAAEKAARAAADAQRLAQDRALAAAKLQQAEAATQDVAARIELLAAQRQDAQQRLDQRAAAMQPLLPLIERLSLYPVETLLAVPASPEATLRGVLVLKGLSRQIEQEAEALRQSQADLDAATTALQEQAPALTAARDAEAQEADALDQQIAASHALRAQAEAEAALAASQAAAAAARADTLRSALSALEAQQRAEAARTREDAVRAERQKAAQAEQQQAIPAATGSIASSAAANGQLQPPVIGVVVRGWGEHTDSGPATGLSYHAPPGARVISPCGGRAVFADTFRSYGLLLIVDCGGGYHIVLSGLDRLDVRLGQHIVRGEPVGVMANWEPGSSERRPALYVELRHDGLPINPGPWLRSSN